MPKHIRQSRDLEKCLKSCRLLCRLFWYSTVLVLHLHLQNTPYMETINLQEELQELFTQLPSAKLSGDANNDIRFINYSLLETIVKKMMNIAYYTGRTEGIESVEKEINNIF